LTNLYRRTFSITASAAMLGGFNIARAQSDSKIILGQSAAFTGAAAQLGIQFYNGATLCFDQVNAQGGVGKRLIEIRKLDDGYEPDRCADNTRKLLADDVFALFGYIGTPTSIAALPLAIKEKVPFIAPFTGAMALRDPFNRYAFHVRASYNDETALIVKQLTHLGLKKIAVFYQNDAYGKAGLSGSWRWRGSV
jgi:branched-chain amino acid transport system substrate-binding protein